MNRWRKNRRRKEPQPQEGGEQKQAFRPISFAPLLRPFGYLAAAFRFLTLFPLPGRLGTTEEELAHSAPFFPLIGLLLGCIAAPAAQLLFSLLPPLPAAVLLTFILLAFSGGLHLDGLADTADGFFSARNRERMLEIMRDSAVGPMGVIALVLLLLFKTACLASLNAQLFFSAAFLMPLAGRTAILLLMALLPYAREGGLGSLFAAYFNSSKAWLASLAGFLLFTWVAHAAVGPQGIVAVLAVLLLTVLFAVLCRCKIGGATGDTLGAACELAEAIALLVFALKI
ncbi:MAG: cobalamin-5'-phosphate synthase [Candidatus Electronema aureum]|uniref:Adenosylcobinamide-GDP ribazoletransferase n=1 Tax=Candidatus Electronema aureum TaxID=2005002 RepID=A0A521G2C0_9BACT|nr:MAG: cobalamin-5'-phosphate synthase [Candidatus Electronema aureum]